MIQVLERSPMAAQHDDPLHDRPPAARAGTRAALDAPSTAAPGAPTASLSILAASVLAARMLRLA
ncbi:hypothetical protein, partial [Pseudacidovorax intermedius]